MKIEGFTSPHGNAEDEPQEFEVTDVFGGSAGRVKDKAVSVETNLVCPIWSRDEHFHNTLLHFLMQIISQITLICVLY